MTSHYDFDQNHPRRNTNCAKWDLVEPEVLPLWVADMDFLPPPEVNEALQEAVEHGIFGYSYFGTQVQEAVAGWLARRHGWQVPAEWVVLVPGVVTGFNFAAYAVAQPGEGVLVQTPAYGPFQHVAEHLEMTQQTSQLPQDENGRYYVDLEAFEAAITPETRIFILCNPQNPTGRVFTREELQGMADICLRHDVWICSDEIHSDLVYSGYKHIPVASLSEEIAAKTITLVAPSKTFNIPGLRGSAAIIPDEDVRKRFIEAQHGLMGGVNSLGQVAMQAAYEHGEPWLEALLDYLGANRNYLAEFVETRLPGVKMVAPEGTYLAWLDCRALNLETKEGTSFNPFFEEQAKVALNDGLWFGPGGEGFVRLNFGCPRATLVEALERMEEALVGVVS